MNPVHVFLPNFFKIHFNITLLCTRFLPLRFSLKIRQVHDNVHFTIVVRLLLWYSKERHIGS
jgi:hypothetical protein